MQIESAQQITSSKLNSVVSLFVYLISNIEITFLNTIEFHNFIQFINYNMSWLEVPRLQVLNQLHYKALVNRIMKVVKRISSKFIKALTFDVSRHVVCCL